MVEKYFKNKYYFIVVVTLTANRLSRPQPYLLPREGIWLGYSVSVIGFEPTTYRSGATIL